MSAPALVPYPLGVLLGRVVREWETRRRIFDLPTARFHRSDPGLDLSIGVGRGVAATPIGPAAGPHTQLAQNIVLGWLAGARTFELKTVQVLDELVIPRPCIDMEGVGYNVEWSQELRIRESLEEYVKAWMMLHVLSRWEPLGEMIGHPGPHVFDMSVGYDLEGISSAPMDAFIRGLLDASEVVDRLRPQIPEPFGAHRDDDFGARIVHGATLSTFHGCPPGEIEGIARHLMSEYGLDVVVKLNPTLLGIDSVDEILRGRLGYSDTVLSPAAFDADLGFDDALHLIRSLRDFAAEHGRTFGIKLTNTLMVGNHLRRLPGDEMYLSGAPLHVLAIALLDRLVEALPGVLGIGPDGGPVPVSFSAGIDRDNTATAVGLGLTPVTVCTTLLKPGGYGNLSSMLNALTGAMKEAGCSTIPSWVAAQDGAAREAGHRDAVAAYNERLQAASAVAAYTAEGITHRSRSVDRDLDTFDCVSCNLCVIVCPNDAMLRLPTPERSGLEEKWQYFCLAELCNDCGNCTTFCPERGDPFLAKPRLFLHEGVFAEAEGQGFLVEAQDGTVEVRANPTAAGDLEAVRLVLAGDQGLPLRAGDLEAAAGR
jgi:putative selenate reductase